MRTAYLVPSDDPHLSEYVPAAYMRRGYLTDFHGSAGTALVLTDSVGSRATEKTEDVDMEAGKGAYLWTDSRSVCTSFCVAHHHHDLDEF